MTRTILRSACALVVLALTACGETSGSVLESVPEPAPSEPDEPDTPPGTNLRLDVFVIRDVESCAVGEPCRDPDARGGGCFEIETPSGEGMGFEVNTLDFLPPNDERALNAQHKLCFHLGMDDEQVSTLGQNLTELRNRIYRLSRNEINLTIHPIEIATMTAGFEQYENERGIYLQPRALEPVARELSRETDFVFAVTGGQSVIAPLNEHCVRTDRELEDGLAGAGYTWLTTECDGTDTLLRQWLFQVTVALREANGFNDRFDRDYPPCGEAQENPAEWFPNPDECSVDPDAPTCGENRCEGTDDDYVGHVLTDHWPRGRDFVGNHCNNRRMDGDLGETDVDIGGPCDLLGP